MGVGVDVCVSEREGEVSHPCLWHAGCPTRLLTPISFYISEGLAEIEVIIYTESFTSYSLNVLSLTDLHLQCYLPNGYSLMPNLASSEMFILVV